MSEAQAPEQTPLTKRNEVNFSFRKNKDTGARRETVTLNIEVPTWAGILEYINKGDEKTVSLIEDLIAQKIFDQVRQAVDGDLDYNQEVYEKSKDQYNINVIANLPRAERNVVSKDDLEAFAEDYVAVMVEASGKEKTRVQTAAAMFVEKFKRVSGDDNALKILQQQLSVFVEAANDEMVSKHEKVINYLMAKLEELLSVKITADVL